MIIQTVSGLSVDVMNPDPSTIELSDMAASVARLNVLHGQTSERWTYADRAVVAMQLLQGDRRAQLGALIWCGVRAWGGGMELAYATLRSIDGLDVDMHPRDIRPTLDLLAEIETAEKLELTDLGIIREKYWLLNAARALISARIENRGESDECMAVWWRAGILEGPTHD